MKKYVFSLIMSILAVSSMAQAPKFETDNALYKFPDTREGELLSHTFTITNTGDAPLIISEYKVACPCTKAELPTKPIIFSKPPTTVTATNTEIIKNTKLTSQLDWECELAVIISKKGKYVPKSEALDYVFGYTVINDISARDCRREGQWIVSKGQDTFAPMGPVIVTKDEIENPHNLNLSLKVNGVEKQNSNTKFMLFNINDLIEDLSTVFTLEPGDIIATGTPAGVGAGRDPQEWMYDGDVVEATVEGIGTIVNTIKEI
mgnify:CR=1 FL=1